MSIMDKLVSKDNASPVVPLMLVQQWLDSIVDPSPADLSLVDMCICMCMGLNAL